MVLLSLAVAPGEALGTEASWISWDPLWTRDLGGGGGVVLTSEAGAALECRKKIRQQGDQQ